MSRFKRIPARRSRGLIVGGFVVALAGSGGCLSGESLGRAFAADLAATVASLVQFGLLTAAGI